MTRFTPRGATLLLASAALTVGLVSGCSAGQVTQTESQRPAIDGVNADSADGSVGLRDVAFAYPGTRGYPQGSTAPLHLRIVNTTTSALRLNAVESDAGVVLLGQGLTPSGTGGTPMSAMPSPSSKPGSSPSKTSPDASRDGSVSPTNPVSAGPTGSATIDVRLAPGSLTALDPTSAQCLSLAGLRRPLTPGETVRLTFRFDSGATITVSVPVAIPVSPGTRSPMEMPAEGGEGH